MIGNPVGDMMIRLKNAGAVGHESISVPFSRMKAAVLDVLKKEGFVKSVEKRGKKVRKTLFVQLAYHADGTPRIVRVKQLSTPGRRTYRKARDMHPVRYGKGLLVVSTPNGVLSGAEARAHNVGGEVLFEIS